MTNLPMAWWDGTHLTLTIESAAGPIYRETLPMAVLRAAVNGGEVLRWTWQWTDPEDGEVLSGAARLVLEEIPDPRATATEEQPATPADATAATDEQPAAFHLSAGYLTAFREITGQTANVNPPHDPITPEERAQGVRWVERPSGPPVRVLVDGPGCTPAPVATLTEQQAMLCARVSWPEAEGFERVPGGWTFRVGAGYASITDTGRVATDPQGTRRDAVSYMGRRT